MTDVDLKGGFDCWQRLPEADAGATLCAWWFIEEGPVEIVGWLIPEQYTVKQISVGHDDITGRSSGHRIEPGLGLRLDLNVIADTEPARVGVRFRIPKETAE